MNNLSAVISKNLKNLRRQYGWSLDVASQKTKVSKAMLGQIERGESSPTIATLWKIANGFEISFSSILEEPDANNNHLITHIPSARELYKQDEMIKVTTIFPFDAKLKFEMFFIELLPGCVHLSAPHPKGVIEHVIPICGAIEVLIGKVWHKVNQHDGNRFSADIPHGYRNLSNTPSSFHNIIHYIKV